MEIVEKLHKLINKIHWMLTEWRTGWKQYTPLKLHFEVGGEGKKFPSYYTSP